MQRDFFVLFCFGVFFCQVLSFPSAQQGSSQGAAQADTSTATAGTGDPKSLHVQTNAVDQTVVPNGLFPSFYLDLLTNLSIYTAMINSCRLYNDLSSGRIHLLCCVEIYFYLSVILILGFGKTAHYQQGDAKDTNGARGTEI